MKRQFTEVAGRALLAGAVALGMTAAAVAGPAGSDGGNSVLSARPQVTDLERKVGQLVLIGFEGTVPDDPGVRMVAAQLAEGKISGVTLMPRNIEGTDQLKALAAHLAAQTTGQPAFIGVDQEGGKVQRIGGLADAAYWLAPSLLTHYTENCDPDIAAEYYTKMAASLPDYHINLNFGPVVDLNINPDNPLIGKLERSYSPDPETVSRCAEAFVRGHQHAGVRTSLKHFPGHGSALEDSHVELPFIRDVWQEEELEPYHALAREGLTDMIMMAHVVHPRFSDAPDLPASLSKKGVAAARAIAGPDAVILTDCLEAGAVSHRFSDSEAAVRALEAGNDMVMLRSHERSDPALGDRINRAIVDAIREGRLSLAQIERSAERVQALKAGLNS